MIHVTCISLGKITRQALAGPADVELRNSLTFHTQQYQKKKKIRSDRSNIVFENCGSIRSLEALLFTGMKTENRNSSPVNTDHLLQTLDFSALS